MEVDDGAPDVTGPIGGTEVAPCARHCFHAVVRADCRYKGGVGQNTEAKCCKCGEGHWGNG